MPLLPGPSDLQRLPHPLQRLGVDAFRRLIRVPIFGGSGDRWIIGPGHFDSFDAHAPIYAVGTHPEGKVDGG